MCACFRLQKNNIFCKSFYFLSIFAAISCAEKIPDSEIFNGEIKIIDDTVKSITELQGKAKKLFSMELHTDFQRFTIL